MPKLVTPVEYLARANQVHGGKYRYIESTLCSANKPATVLCKLHGKFQQKLANHLQGAGCPKCAGRGVDWVERFKSVHGDQYDYQRVCYVDYKSPVEILCTVHGSFLQTPDNHYRGQGCPKCKGGLIRSHKQMVMSEFVRRANIVHDGRYVYPTEQFDNVLRSLVKIQCPEHGVFTQTPVNHLAGKTGCSRCSNQKSSQEFQIASFLSKFTQVQSRNRQLIKPKELDIYVPEKKIAIEYCGMYWHSHFTPEDEKQDRLKHHHKYLECKTQGVRLLTIYESEWFERQYAVRRLLRNAVGASRGKLMARKCTIKTPAVGEARAFFERYHPQGGGGAGEHYGLYWKGKLVACMRFTLGANDRGIAKERVWTLTRYATRITVTGGASRLFKVFVVDKQPTEVKSFSDNRYFDGAMYNHLGFTVAEELPPDYQVWSLKLGLRSKAHYQRRAIQQRLKDHGLNEVFDPDTDPRTESEMTYRMGCGRIYDCGKKRWVWNA